MKERGMELHEKQAQHLGARGVGQNAPGKGRIGEEEEFILFSADRPKISILEITYSEL